MLINTTNDMDKRLKDECGYLIDKYPHIAFNHIDWSGKERQNKEYLLACEGFITIPQNYSADVINKYKGIITHNRKWYKENKGRYNILLTNGYSMNVLHNYYLLDDYVPYENKIDGICSLHNIYQPVKQEGSIIWRRDPLIRSINWPIKHTFGPKPWGPTYQGKIAGAIHPNHVKNLEVINRYKFVLSLESTYHEMYSYDWLLDRFFNAIKSKTIPIYYGCYNVEELVPDGLYIDLRKYINNIGELTNVLKSYTKQQYIDQTERAFEWYMNDFKLMKTTKELEDFFEANCR